MEEHQEERKALEEKITNVKREFQQHTQERQEKFTLTIQHQIQEQMRGS